MRIIGATQYIIHNTLYIILHKTLYNIYYTILTISVHSDLVHRLLTEGGEVCIKGLFSV